MFFVKNGPLYEKHPCNVNLWFTQLKHHSLESELYKLSFGVFKFHIRLVVLTQSVVLFIFCLTVEIPSNMPEYCGLNDEELDNVVMKLISTESMVRQISPCSFVAKEPNNCL